MDVQERIKTISESFKELPASEQNALLKRLKDETNASREKRLAEIKKEMEELTGYQEQLNPKSYINSETFEEAFARAAIEGEAFTSRLISVPA